MVLTPAFQQMLADRFGHKVRFGVPMAELTSFRVGGPADAVVAPEGAAELMELMRMLEQERMPWMVLGGGTNLLVKDGGIRGVVISLGRGFDRIGIEGRKADTVFVRAGAGARLSALCRYALEQNLAGMNFAVGIPGTVGGAVLMNAGTAHGSMESVVAGLEVLHVPDKQASVPGQALCFSYRGLSWPDSMRDEKGRGPLVLAGRFSLRPAGQRALAEQAGAWLAQRSRSQPAGFSAGCVFKNPAPDMPAGQLIDRAGLKGFRIGDAQVSGVHANFIINRGRAAAADILRLMEAVREAVARRFHVDLEPEIRIVGEETGETSTGAAKPL